MTKYIKGKDGKFAGSIPGEPQITPPTKSKDLPKVPETTTSNTERKPQGIEWVVTLRLEDGTVIRGVQVAWYGHPAMDFLAKKLNIKYKSASAEKKMHFDRFLAEGLRTPLTPQELNP